MSQSRLQNSPSIAHDQYNFSDNQSLLESNQEAIKTLTKPLGRPRGRGRPKLNTKSINRKKVSQEDISQEPTKHKEKAIALKQENQIQGYVRIVDYLKKIECDQMSFQNKMSPYHSLTASCFWYMVSAQYFSYDFYLKKNPSEAANNILNKVSKLPVQITTRVIKSQHQGQLLQFETEEVKKYGQFISESLSQLIAAPHSINRVQNIEKKASISTVAEDNKFISSTRAILFNYVKNKFEGSQKWATNIKSKLQKIQNLKPKQFQRDSLLNFDENEQQIIDADQLDILSRQAKKKKSQKRKNEKESKNSIQQIDEQENNQKNKHNQLNNNDMQIQQNMERQPKQASNNQLSKQRNEQDSESKVEQKSFFKQMTADQVLLSSILHMPLDKVISILESTLHNSSYTLPQIQPPYLTIPKTDPLQFVYQLHQQEEKYLQYLKDYKKKQYRSKIKKSQNIIDEEQRQTQFEDAKCQICTDGDYTDDNLIVFCSKCNISLHQRCVGLAKVPAQSWVCDVCLAFGPAGINVPCPLCNIKGGALKRTNIHIDNILFKELNPFYYEYAKKCLFNKQKQEYLGTDKPLDQEQKQQNNKEEKDEIYYDYFNKNTYPDIAPTCHFVWIHYVCAIWVPECYFEEKNGAINIKGVQNIQKRRYKYQCIICKKAKSGACVKCDDPECKKYYHPQCARKKKVYMEQLNLQKIKYLIFCEQHQPLKITRQIEYKKKKSRDQIIKFARMIEKYVETYKIAYFPLKLSKIIPTKSFIQTFEKEDKQESVQLKQEPKIQTDSQFMKDIIIKLSKVKKITVTVVKTENGFKISNMNQPSRRQMRKCLNRYDDFWHTIQNNETAEQNWKRYERIMKQNVSLKEKMEIFLNGGSLAGPSISLKPKKGRARGKNAKQQVQTAIEQEGGIFCLCRRPYENELDMIQCEICSEWYHFKCIGFIGSQQDAQKLQFHCMKCMKYQTEEEKKPILQKCRRFFSFDSLYLNYRPPTPKLMSEEDEPQIKQSLNLESQENQNGLKHIAESYQKQITLMDRISVSKNEKQKEFTEQDLNVSHTTLKAKRLEMQQNLCQEEEKQIFVPKLSFVAEESQKMQTTLTKFFSSDPNGKINYPEIK